MTTDSDTGAATDGQAATDATPGRRRRGRRRWVAVVVGVPVVVGGAGSIIGGILSDQGLLPGDSMEAFSGSAVERRSPDFPDPAGPQ